jgi:hypothetical protein
MESIAASSTENSAQEKVRPRFHRQNTVGFLEYRRINLRSGLAASRSRNGHGGQIADGDHSNGRLRLFPSQVGIFCRAAGAYGARHGGVRLRQLGVLGATGVGSSPGLRRRKLSIPGSVEKCGDSTWEEYQWKL